MSAPERIADPWGERAPYGRGEEWPVRVDMVLEPGLAECDVERWVQTASVLHSDGDGYEFAVRDGRIAACAVAARTGSTTDGMKQAAPQALVVA